VDATVQRFRGDVNVNATIDASGKLRSNSICLVRGQVPFPVRSISGPHVHALEAPPPRSTGRADGRR